MADTSISPTSNMDSSDTTSISEQPTIGADATNPADQPQGGTQPYVQSQTQGSPVTPAGQPSQPDQSSQPNQKPVDGTEAPSFGPKDGTPATPGAPGAAPAATTDPALHTASRFYKFAQVLAGGQRYKTSIDPNTGTMKREPVSLSKSDIGMAIAMEAITGALSGLAQSGPGATGRAAAAGAQQVMQQRQQTDQQQDANANADFARHAQVLETNMRLHQNAMTLGHMDFDSNTNYVGQHKELADNIQKNHPEWVKGVIGEDQLSQFHVTKDSGIPVGVTKKLDPTTGEQTVDKYGAPQWQLQYMIIDPAVKGDNFLSDEDKAEAAKFNLPGFADSDGKPTKLPQSLPMRLGMALNYKAKINSLRLAEQNVNEFYDNVNKSVEGGNAPLTVPTVKNAAVQPIVDAAAQKYGVPVALARAVVNQESGGNATAVSVKGAQGVMQLMPATALAMGVQNPLDPQQNIDGGMKYLGQLLKQYNGNTKLALAAYNAGPGNVHDSVPNFPETQNYVASISKAIGLDAPAPKKGDAYKPVDLVAEVKKDPTLVNALEQFQPLLNATGQNYEKAIGELGAKDPQAAGKILSLYGGNSLIYHYDQQRTLDADAAKKKVEGDELLSRQASERSQKNAENQDAYMEDAKAIAGDPNDPGSGDMMALDKLISQRTADRPKVYALAKKINPNFNPANAELKLNMWKGFADPQGKEYQQVKSFNTLFDHIGGALEASNNFHNSSYGEAINKPINEFKKRFEGDPNLANLITSLQPVKSEFMTFLNNQHALTEHDKSAGDDIMNWNMSPAVLEANLKKFADTAAYRAVEVNNGWHRVFGRDYPDLLSSDAVNTLRKLGPQSAAYNTLQNMQTGGSILGSSDGRGVAGQTLSQAMNNRASNTPAIDPRTPPGATPGWDPTTGKQLGYRTPDGKEVRF